MDEQLISSENSSLIAEVKIEEKSENSRET